MGQSAADFTKDFWRIFPLVLMAGVFWSALIFYDLFKSYQERRRNWYPLMKAMVEKLGQGKDGLTTEELKSVAGILVQSPSSTKGLARQAIALTVATIISIILVLLLLIGGGGDRELVKTIVTALVASFTTIVGFYFGARTAEGGVETAAAAAAVTTSPSRPGPPRSGPQERAATMDTEQAADLNEKPLQPGTQLSDADREYMEESDDFDTQWAQGDTPESGGKV